MDSQESQIRLIDGATVPEVELAQSLKQMADLVTNTCEFFFKGKMSLHRFPFKGFILSGPPGTGKTEIVKQCVRKLDRRIRNVSYVLVDGATIASPRWGDAEKSLRSVFSTSREMADSAKARKVIILFDDVESLMLARGADLAKEWHYSINSVLFHEIDDLDPTKTLVAATTNRLDLIDDALASRLYKIEIPPIEVQGLRTVINNILSESDIDQRNIQEVEKRVIARLSKLKQPTIRDAQQLTVIDCIENGLWSI
jgi:SpoVK/Ycf46/Vps4 family AAA+-type ATPase